MTKKTPKKNNTEIVTKDLIIEELKQIKDVLTFLSIMFTLSVFCSVIWTMMTFSIRH